MIEASEVTVIETIEDADEVTTPYFAMRCASDDLDLPEQVRAEKGDYMIFSKPDVYHFGDIAILTSGDCVEVTVDTPDYMLVGKLEEVSDSRF